MEYVEGGTLKNIVEHDSASLSTRKVLEIAIQICEGLDAAHEKGIVHRDIKSDNIMLTPKGQVKMMDFGLAKLKGATRITRLDRQWERQRICRPNRRRGKTSTIVRTSFPSASSSMSYSPPIFLSAATIRQPFSTRSSTMSRLLLHALTMRSPRNLKRIVSKALAKDKEERYQHIDDLLADLRRERKNLEYARSGYVKASALASGECRKTIGTKALKNPHGIENSSSRPSGGCRARAVAFFFFNPFRSTGR